MKLALAIQTAEVPATVPVALLSGTFEEKLARAAQLGAQGIEFMAADPGVLDANAIRTTLKRHGLEAAAVGSGAVPLTAGLTLLHADPARSIQAQERLRALITFAAGVGAPIVTIGSFRGRLGAVGPGGRERLLAVLRQAATYAEGRGVRLALEPLNRYEADLVNTADQGVAFVREAGHPAFGLLLDTFHVNIEESAWTEPFRRVMAEGLLWHVHLGDNNRLPPGRGLIDFAAIVRTLREIGYAGFLSAELLARPDPDTAAVETVAHMRPLLED